MTDVWSSLGLGGPTPLERMSAYGRRQAEVNRRAIAENRFPVPGEDPELDSMRQDIAGMFDFTNPLQWGSLGLGGVIRAYHGSPHTFDKFDMSKIGTGEGAQAYGHGLYFAESPGVARSYRDAMAGPTPYAGDRPLSEVVPDKAQWQGALAYLDMNSGDIDKAIQNATDSFSSAKARVAEDRAKGRAQIADLNERQLPHYQSAIDGLQQLKELGSPPVTRKQDGGFYTVDLNVNHEDLLDWDKPLSQQPAKVRKGLKDAGLMQSGRESWTGQMLMEWLPRAAARYREDATKLLENAKQLQASGRPLQVSVSDLTQQLDELGDTPRWSANQLRSAGIPGIRYLDGGSRADGEGSRNIVLFGDDLVKILERNGQPVAGK